jgi:hypothetical protein
MGLFYPLAPSLRCLRNIGYTKGTACAVNKKCEFRMSAFFVANSGIDVHRATQPMIQRVILLAFGLLVTACAQQPATPQQSVNCPGVTSPDQQLRACVLSVGTHPNPPFNESRVEIRSMNGPVLATKDFKSPDGEHGRNVQKMEWSPDSQFFVFSTASSGGHSPWHWQTYFYDRKRKTFKEVDDFTGPVIKRNFKLTAPDWIEVRVQGTPGDPSDINTGHSVKRRLSTMN